jgi:hypothetical protein
MDKPAGTRDQSFERVEMGEEETEQPTSPITRAYLFAPTFTAQLPLKVVSKTVALFVQRRRSNELLEDTRGSMKLRRAMSI